MCEFIDVLQIFDSLEGRGRVGSVINRVLLLGILVTEKCLEGCTETTHRSTIEDSSLCDYDSECGSVYSPQPLLSSYVR